MNVTLRICLAFKFYLNISSPSFMNDLDEICFTRLGSRYFSISEYFMATNSYPSMTLPLYFHFLTITFPFCVYLSQYSYAFINLRSRVSRQFSYTLDLNVKLIKFNQLQTVDYQSKFSETKRIKNRKRLSFHQVRFYFSRNANQR